MTYGNLRIVLVCILAGLAGTSVFAENKTWSGGTTYSVDNWNTAANWSGGTLPTTTSSVVINTAGAQVGFAPGVATSSTIKDLYVGSTTLGSPVSLTLTDGTLNVTGSDANWRTMIGDSTYKYAKLTVQNGATLHSSTIIGIGYQGGNGEMNVFGNVTANGSNSSIIAGGRGGTGLLTVHEGAVISAARSVTAGYAGYGTLLMTGGTVSTNTADNANTTGFKITSSQNQSYTANDYYGKVYLSGGTINTLNILAERYAISPTKQTALFSLVGNQYAIYGKDGAGTKPSLSFDADTAASAINFYATKEGIGTMNVSTLKNLAAGANASVAGFYAADTAPELTLIQYDSVTTAPSASKLGTTLFSVAHDTDAKSIKVTDMNPAAKVTLNPNGALETSKEYGYVDLSLTPGDELMINLNFSGSDVTIDDFTAWLTNDALVSAEKQSDTSLSLTGLTGNLFMWDFTAFNDFYGNGTRLSLSQMAIQADTPGVPEPATWLLFSLMMGGMAVYRFRGRK